MLQRCIIYLFTLLCFSACKKETTVCKDENAINYGMEDENGGASCVFAIEINENLYGKWKVDYHLVYDLPPNTTLNSLISEYASFTFVQFEEFYEEDYPLSEIEWAEFITNQEGLYFNEDITPEDETVFTEIEYTGDQQVQYYYDGNLNVNLMHYWNQFDYDHLAYFDENYIPFDETDLVEILILDELKFDYRRVLKQGNTTRIEYRRMVKNY
tara:strand:+ start:674 stop:1312 length:639 start_codon:yes stop_codon:yes gene_type:complete